MAKRKSKRRRKRSRKILWLIAGITAAITFGMAVYMLILAKQGNTLTKPDELLLAYMDCISERNYKEMYQMLEIQNMTTAIISYNEERNVVKYQTTFDTVAGNISFENEAYFLKREDGYKLVWTDSLIYPGLSSTDKVRVSTTQAKRGEILDRNGRVLAGPG